MEPRDVAYYYSLPRYVLYVYSSLRCCSSLSSRFPLPARSSGFRRRVPGGGAPAGRGAGGQLPVPRDLT